ncbi:MAG: ABC transporter ATP-binding protein [Rhodoglobus sp.]
MKPASASRAVSSASTDALAVPPLVVSGLSIAVEVDGESRPLLDGVSLRVEPGEIVGLVGESGSGKSVTSRAALGLFPGHARTSGSVVVDGVEVIGASTAELRELRQTRASMIFQDPRSSVNPVRRLGDFITEGLRARGTAPAEANRTAVGLLEEVGIRDAAGAMRRFPHEFSGGMLQRIVIAAALSIGPRLVLADEATTALDVTTQAEVVALLKRLQVESGTGMLFVTHDLELAAAMCDRIVVMYAGRVVETGTAAAVFANPQHPYTVGLLGSNPRLTGERAILTPIAGRPLALSEAPSGCAFRDRCPIAVPECAEEVPAARLAGSTDVACIRPGDAKAA